MIAKVNVPDGKYCNGNDVYCPLLHDEIEPMCPYPTSDDCEFLEQEEVDGEFFIIKGSRCPAK